MKICVFGGGIAGKFLVNEIIDKRKDIEIIAILDNIMTGTYQNITIFKPEEFFKNNKTEIDSVFIAAGAQKTVKLMIDVLRQNTDCDLYMLHDIAGKNQLSPFDKDGDINARYLRKIRFSEEKPTLPYMEIPVTDLCNLNCKGCLFACNAMGGSEHIPSRQIISDAERMRELFEDIPWIRLLGGEPLMHPDIIDILNAYREIYPDSEIDLCTNGLLITKMQEDVFNCLRKNEITIHVSGYKPTYRMLGAIDAKLKSEGLQYTVLRRDSFQKYYTSEPCNNADYSYANCIASGCRELYNGRLIRCSAVIAFEKFNEQFGMTYTTVEEEDWFDIHKPEIDAWKMKERIDRSSQVCRYCNVNHQEEFAWDYAGSKASIDDYIVG